jgi:transposase
VELITRGERRRRWSTEQKQDIVAESLEPGTTPTEVARKYAISSGLLYGWRQQLLCDRPGTQMQTVQKFARVELAAAPAEPEMPERTTAEPSGLGVPTKTSALGGLIEIVLPRGVVLRVDAQVDGRALRRVLGVLEGR